jgi:hypothetical protein
LFPKSANDYPKDYFVPDFGIDKDILDAQSHEAKALTGKWLD